MDAPTCEQCRSRPGAPYSFHYGRLGGTDISPWSSLGGGNLQREVTSHFIIGGVDTAFLCERCLTRARLHRAGRVMRREFVGFPLFWLFYALPVLWLGATLWQGQWAQAALWLVLVLAVPLVAFGLFFAFMPEESTGEWAGIELHRSRLEEAGWTQFWTTREFAKLKPDTRR
jgi:hypothetical protein